jgi:hypothetical protein
MLSKKSFGGIYEDFLKLPMRSMRGDVWDHIASQKNDHGLSYRHYKASQRRSSPKITICEIFGVVRFSTFSTASVKLRRTQCEHMISALPSNSDIPRRSRHVSSGPNSDMPRMASLGRFRRIIEWFAIDWQPSSPQLFRAKQTEFLLGCIAIDATNATTKLTPQATFGQPR